MAYNNILKYALKNKYSIDVSAVSSNEIRFFEYNGKKYVLKTSLMTGNNISPYIPVVKFIAAEKNNAIFEYMDGNSRNTDEFPKGENNAFKIGQYIGYNHRETREFFGMVTAWIKYFT